MISGGVQAGDFQDVRRRLLHGWAFELIAIAVFDRANLIDQLPKT